MEEEMTEIQTKNEKLLFEYLKINSYFYLNF